jgi:hypothetical protein
MKIGMHVATVRACGALAENGSVDLAEGTKGVLLSRGFVVVLATSRGPEKASIVVLGTTTTQHKTKNCPSPGNALGKELLKTKKRSNLRGAPKGGSLRGTMKSCRF